MSTLQPRPPLRRHSGDRPPAAVHHRSTPRRTCGSAEARSENEMSQSYAHGWPFTSVHPRARISQRGIPKWRRKVLVAESVRSGSAKKSPRFLASRITVTYASILSTFPENPTQEAFLWLHIRATTKTSTGIKIRLIIYIHTEQIKTHDDDD